MSPYAKQSGLGLFAGFILLSGAVSGSEVYKWVAVDGTTHYSEVRPESDLATVELLEITATDPLQPVSRSYQSLLDVANSIEASRLERERLRLEKRKLRLQEEQVRQRDLAQTSADKTYVAGGYYYPRYFRHHRKHQHGDGWPRPEHRPRLRGERLGFNSPVYMKREGHPRVEGMHVSD